MANEPKLEYIAIGINYMPIQLQYETILFSASVKELAYLDEYRNDEVVFPVGGGYIDMPADITVLWKAGKDYLIVFPMFNRTTLVLESGAVAGLTITVYDASFATLATYTIGAGITEVGVTGVYQCTVPAALIPDKAEYPIIINCSVVNCEVVKSITLDCSRIDVDIVGNYAIGGRS